MNEHSSQLPALFKISGLMAYLDTGRNNARIIGERAGAVVRVGRNVLYRRGAIDKYVETHDRLV